MTNFKKPVRRVSKVFLHCTASNNRRLSGQHLREEIHRWHLERGWSGIGYHFVVDFDGQVMIGRDIEAVPSAQQGHNTGSIAICAHGLHKADFTEAQLAAVRALCEQINVAYSGAVTFHGHCEVSPKACPVFDYRSLLGLDAAGRVGGVDA